MKSLTLLELLRRRSALTVEETRRLLDELPGLLDVAERDGDLPSGNLLNSVDVVFAMNAEGDCAGASVCEWLGFGLALLALIYFRRDLSIILRPGEEKTTEKIC